VLVPRNYWNTVGKDKEFFPEIPRPESIPEFDSKGKVLREPSDEWWINSKEDNYCFWSYVKNHSYPDGRMDPLLQADLANLFGCSGTKIHFMLKEALKNLLNIDNLEELKDLVDNSHEESQAIQINSKGLSFGNEEPEDSDF
jgi:hypothetical protein